METFEVVNIFRPTQRAGPVLVGRATAEIRVGTRLQQSGQPGNAVEVIAVDMPTGRSSARGEIAVVVSPDLGDGLVPGLVFEVHE